MNFASRLAYINHSDSEGEEVVVDDSHFEVPAPLAAAAPIAPPAGSAGSGDDDAFFSAQAAPRRRRASFADADSGSSDDEEPAEAKRPEDSMLLGTVRRVFDGLLPSRSVSRSLAPPPPPPAAQRQQEQMPRFRNRKPKTFRRKVDTNVVSLRLGSLGENAPVATGDAVYCEGCTACLSSISTLTAHPSGEGSKWLWSCEFCGRENTVELEEEEKPNPEQQTVDYIIEHAAEATASGQQDGFTVFCIDISGSMCVTQEISGNFKLLGDRRTAMAGLRAHGDNHDQRLPNERRNVTYVSRLQAVQAAVQSQIKRIAEEQPTAKVAIVTFNHEVTVIGDGSGQPTIVSGDRLSNFEALLERGRSMHDHAPISECQRALEEKLFKLEEGGPTALGPAVVTALGMCEGKPGSRIVVCTDGLANVGLGNVDGLEDDAAKETADQFYDRVGQLAADQGTCIDVVGIRSEGCDLERLGRMAELANGNVSLVDPLNLHNDFHGMFANPVVATKVAIKLLLHRGLRFRSTDGSPAFSASADAAAPTTPADHDSVLHHMVGNVTTDTELSFEYQLRPSAERRALGIGELTMLPFQLQITYTRLNGMKCVRVMTQSQQVTTSRAEAEQEADLRVLSSHAAQQTAKMASAGVYTQSRGNMRVWSNFMTDIAANRSRTAEERQQRLQTVNMYTSDMTELDAAVVGAQVNEEAEYGRTYSDDEGDGTTESGAFASAQDIPQMPKASVARASVAKARREMRSKNDDLSNRIQKTSKKSYF